MKKHADRKRTDKEFKEVDYVYLRLIPYRKISVAMIRNLKLSPRYYGPYRILSRVGKVAYRLDLPREAQIHPTFHISCLKLKIGAHIQVQSQLPQITSERALTPESEAVLKCRLKKKYNRA